MIYLTKRIRHSRNSRHPPTSYAYYKRACITRFLETDSRRPEEERLPLPICSYNNIVINIDCNFFLCCGLRYETVTEKTIERPLASRHHRNIIGYLMYNNIISTLTGRAHGDPMRNNNVVSQSAPNSNAVRRAPTRS